MIAPEQFLKEMEISFAKGDKVEILGSQVLAEGAPLLLAREVTRNGDIMLMRDDFGKPVWLGWPK
jgi:Glu-tRNA(Gln) amidotransferase subunit E-like FAD-binding protein